MARTFSVPIIGQSAASGAQVIDGSLKFDDGNKHHLLRTHTAGDTMTFTWAGWVKRDKYGGYQTIFGHVSGGSGQHYIDFGSDKIRFTRYVSSNEAALETTAVFRDTGWYHIVAIWDTTNATANDRQRLYVNGEQITDFSTRVNPSQNYAGAINTAIQHGICRIPTLDQNYNACRMSQAYFIDGRALGPENFGVTDPLTNIWKPKKFDIGAENNPNNGTTWNSTYSAAFAGNAMTDSALVGSYSGLNSSITITLSSSVQVASSLKLNLYANVGSFTTYTTVSINGTDQTSNLTLVESTGSNSGIWELTGFTGTLSSIALGAQNGANNGISRVIVDGYTLINGASDNSFYLPFDGNSLIGKDQSGNGHDWTPQNFGGSNSIDKATGAKPILNTTQGGTQAGHGVFGSNENKFYTVTTANGSVYQFDLTSGDNPSLNFIRGATYRFDYTSFSSHPLRFSSTNPDSSTTAYTDGTNTSVSNVISITVPHNAPDTLYYYCTAHASAMNGAISVTTDETKADPYAWKCVLALPLVGIASDVCASIACTASTKTMSNNGATASSERGNFYDGSFDFAGGEDIRTPSSADFAYGTGDFTWEAWFYHDTSTNNQYIIDHGNNYGTILYNSSNEIAYFVDSSQNASFGTIAQNKWHHVAVSRSSGVTNGFLDGKKTLLSSNDTSSFGTEVVAIGEHGPGSYNWEGNIQDVRLYHGVGKYTEDFIPASTSPDILPDTPSGVVGDSKLTKITDGAVSFDGTGDYLRNTSIDPIGTSDYTIECFFYLDHIAGTRQYIWDGRNSSGGKGTYLIKNQANNWFWTPDNSTSNDNALPLEAIPVNRWTHVAFVRESGTGKMYVDGILKATLTSHGGNLNSDTVTVGAAFDNTVPMTGQVSNYRIIKGTALYTSNFTPPTKPLTEVTNTKLLCCQSNTQPGAAVTSPTMGGINNGTNWTHFLTTNAGDNFDASGPKYYAFDGDGSNKAYTGNNSDGTTQGVSYLQVNFPNPISGALRVKCDNGNEVINVSGQDVGIGTQSTGSDNQFVDCGTVSNLTNLRVLMAGASRPAISIVEVDGVNLVDPLSPIGNVSASNFNPFNTDINTVRGQETGYATLNPLDSNLGSNLKDGSLQAVGSSNWSAGHARGSIALTSGKWFWESTYSAGSSTLQFGFANTSASLTETYGTVPVNSWTYYFPNSSILFPSGGVSTYFPSGASLGDTIGCALDMDNKTWQFFKNGVGGAVYTLPETRSATTQTINELYPWVGSYNGTQDINFGQKPFKFPPPDGFQPLNLANIRPVKVISRPDRYVGIVTYMGSGTTTGRLIKGLNFNDKPDMIWIKNRGEAIDHILFDSVRGFGANKELTPNGQYSEGQTGSGKPNTNVWGFVKTNNFNGFTVESGTTGQSVVNNNNIDYVAWCWKAGGNSGNFNIDHVGYSTAGDAAMSIADQNTTGYNTDQNWGSGATGEINPGGGALESGCFNGDFSDSINSKWGDTSKAITYTFNNLPFKKLRFYGVGSNISASYVKFNGVAQTQAKIGLTNLKFGWFDAVDVPSPLNKIEVYTAGSADFLSLYAVEVDGKILVNNNITPPNLPSIPATGASVGTEQGFSIVTYTGTGSAGTIPHRLTQDPEFVIFKQRNNEDDWRIFHKFLDDDEPQDYYLMLQSSNGKSADQNQSFMNRVPPTGPVIHLGTDSAINGSSTTMVAYSWHSVPGLQKFGFYNGNGSSSGPFIELGFRPAIVWVKRTDSTTDNWYINDSTRDPFNVTGSSLKANLARAEATTGASFSATWDILSNGFKLRDSGTGSNTSGVRYIYCAWAEAPSVNLYGDGANAR